MSQHSRRNPRPARIPEQKQITPELEEKQRQRAFRKEAYYRRMFVLRMVGLALLVVGVPLVFAIYALRDKGQKDIDEQAIAMTGLVDSLDRVLASGDVGMLIDCFQKLEPDVYSGEVAQQVNAIRNRSRIADKLIELNQDDKTTVFGIRAKLDTLISLSLFGVAFKTLDNATLDLFEYSLRNVKSQYPRVRSKAEVGILTSHVHNYVKQSTDENFQKLAEELQNFFDGLNPDGEVVTAIAGIGSVIRLSSRDDQVKRFNILFAEYLLDSSDLRLQEIGVELLDRTIVGPIDFYILRQLILISDRESIKQLEAIVSDICDNPNVSASIFRNTLNTVEVLRRVNEDALEKRLVAYLRGTIPRISSEEVRQEVARLISDFDMRQKLLGNAFVPIRKLYNNVVAAQESPITVVVFYSALSDLSVEVVESLSNLNVGNDIHVVIVCVDSAIAPKESAAFRAIFPRGTLIAPKENGDFLRACPVSTVPYILLLDQDQTVVALNLGVDQVRASVEKLQSR